MLPHSQSEAISACWQQYDCVHYSNCSVFYELDCLTPNSTFQYINRRTSLKKRQRTPRLWSSGFWLITVGLFVEARVFTIMDRSN